MTGDNKNIKKQLYSSLRACLHGGGGGGGGPQVSEVPDCPFNLSYGHPTYHINVIN